LKGRKKTLLPKIDKEGRSALPIITTGSSPTWEGSGVWWRQAKNYEEVKKDRKDIA